MKRLSFAIIGGGPAGFYTAKLLTKFPCNPQIHIYEKELCPFGLIRYGVAPDHVSIKRSEVVLSQIEKYPEFQYIGNSNVNEQKLKQLQQQYSGVIFSIGASGDTVPLGLKQENHHVKNYPSVKLARELVYWYNNHPEYENYNLDLTNVKDVTIVGNGNVAIDIARILLRKPSQLALTQISPNALQALKQSTVENVTIVGRRGIVQSAFALKEIRQLTKCGIKIYAVQQELQASLNDASHHQCTALGNYFNNVIRQNKRKIDFFKENVEIIQEKDLQKLMRNKEKKIILRFLLNPHEIRDNDKLSFNKTYLQGEPFKQKAVDTDEVVDIHHDLLVFSTGFQVKNIDGSKTKSNKISNSNGCLINDSSQKVLIGRYASGWCKTGPQGVIDQTLLGCEQTFNNIRIHYQNHVLEQKPTIATDAIFNPQVNSSWEQYKKLREIELKRGNEAKYIKKKLSKKETLQLYGLNL